MRAYELMVIISGKLDESTAHGWLKTITNSINNVGGQVHGNPEWWGRRQLAYPIQKMEHGYYGIFNVIAPAGAYAISASADGHIPSPAQSLTLQELDNQTLDLSLAPQSSREETHHPQGWWWSQTQPGTGLSGCQQQRLVIARAIAINPEVILMDEPCSALDPIATARIEELIDELRAQYCIIIVTHSMAQAARVSQRTAFFHMGRLVEAGPTGDIFTRPGDSRTQDYITGRFG